MKLVNLNNDGAKAPAAQFATAFAVAAGTLLLTPLRLGAQPQLSPQTNQQTAHDPANSTSVCASSTRDSAYIPVDGWVYPAMIQLYAMGYASNVCLGMRPLTRGSVNHMLEETSAQIQGA
jgi:hypothetical protein